MTRPGVLLAGILALAAAFRVVVLFENMRGPLFSFLRLDELQYEEAARMAMQGDLFPAYVPTNAPGYSWFVGALYFIFGHSLLVPRLAQIMLGLGSIVLVHRIGRRLFGESAGLVSALLLALYWPLMIFEQRLLSASLFLFLNLAGLWAAARAADRENSRPWALAGLILGAAALVRPEAILLIIILSAWLLLRAAGEKKGQRLEQALGLIALAFVVIAPVIQVQHRVSGEWTLLQTNGGLNLYLGNNPDSDGTPYARPGGTWDALAAMPVKEAGLAKDSDQDRFFLMKVLEFARREPLRFAGLLLRKLGLLLNRREIRATIDPEFQRSLFPALFLPLPGFALILALAASGLLALRPLDPRRRVLALYTLSYGAVTALTVVSSRYRLPFTVGLVILAGAGAEKLAESATAIRLRKAGRKSLAPLALFAIALAAAWLPWRLDYTPAEGYAYLGEAWLAQGNPVRAGENYLKALELDPADAQAMMGLARIEIKRGNQEAAEQRLSQAVAADPGSADARYELGSQLWRRGRREEAVAELQKAVELAPQSIILLYWLAYYERRMGMDQDARERLLTALMLRPDFEPARALLLEMESQ